MVMRASRTDVSNFWRTPERRGVWNSRRMLLVLVLVAGAIGVLVVSRQGTDRVVGADPTQTSITDFDETLAGAPALVEVSSIADIPSAGETTPRDLPDVGDKFPLVALRAGVVRDVKVELIPIELTSAKSSTVTVSLKEHDGVNFLEIYLDDAIVADHARYWMVEVDGQVRSRNSAIAADVMGLWLSDGAVTSPLTVKISTTDEDERVVQSTGEIRFQPAP